MAAPRARAVAIFANRDRARNLSLVGEDNDDDDTQNDHRVTWARCLGVGTQNRLQSRLDMHQVPQWRQVRHADISGQAKDADCCTVRLDRVLCICIVDEVGFNLESLRQLDDLEKVCCFQWWNFQTHQTKSCSCHKVLASCTLPLEGPGCCELSICAGRQRTPFKFHPLNKLVSDALLKFKCKWQDTWYDSVRHWFHVLSRSGIATVTNANNVLDYHYVYPPDCGVVAPQRLEPTCLLR